MCARERVCVRKRESVCVCERERMCERECVCVCVCMRNSVSVMCVGESVSVSTLVFEFLCE